MILRRLTILAVVTAALAMFPAVCLRAETPKSATIAYDDLALKIEIREPYQKQALPAGDDSTLADAYIHNGLIYVVQVRKTPPDFLTSTAIETAIQAEAKAAAATGGSKRWELYSRKKDLFKGLSRQITFDDAVLERAPFIKDVAQSNIAYQSMASTPLSGDTSPILTVGVIGPQGRETEIENEAKFLAFSVTRMAKDKPNKPSTLPAPPEPAKKTSPAPPAKVKATLPLGKGDIELSGTVALIDQAGKRLTLNVGRIRMPGQEPIDLKPTRTKTVFYEALPGGVTRGARLVVIGRNDGVGKPIYANFVEVADE